MIPPVNSLVKFDNPVLVSSAGGKKGLAPSAKPELTQTEDILNSILPPREWTEDGQLWIQYVSSTPATRLDVINVQEHLDRKLQERQARETGICPVREELYAQCFDELIRQVTVNCAERGLLLLRVRDEMRMTIAAYQTLYESSVAFGMRKALQAEQGKSDMESKIKSLETEKKELERNVQELKAKCEAIEKREAERRALEEKKHAEEVQFLKRTNGQLKQQLENFLAREYSNVLSVTTPRCRLTQTRCCQQRPRSKWRFGSVPHIAGDGGALRRGRRRRGSSACVEGGLREAG